MEDHEGQDSRPTRAYDPRPRALVVWPGLDRRKLARTCGDPDRVARLVERRTALPCEAILALLAPRSRP